LYAAHSLGIAWRQFSLFNLQSSSSAQPQSKCLLLFEPQVFQRRKRRNGEQRFLSLTLLRIAVLAPDVSSMFICEGIKSNTEACDRRSSVLRAIVTSLRFAALALLRDIFSKKWALWTTNCAM
jgi:hypothetical protein